MRAFLTVAVIHFLALASPGPDFAIIVKQSLTQSRHIAVWTALGLAMGILLHVSYCLLGIGFVISRSILLFNTLKLLGASYLIYIGWKSLFAKPSKDVDPKESHPHETSSRLHALRSGFLCNALNPKATLFFFALFTQVIDPATPIAIQLFYGLYMSAATFLWFALLGSMFSVDLIRRHVHAFHLWIERVMGVVLIALGLKVAFASRK